MTWNDWTDLSDDELRHRLAAAGMSRVDAIVAIAKRDTAKGAEQIERWLNAPR